MDKDKRKTKDKDKEKDQSKRIIDLDVYRKNKTEERRREYAARALQSHPGCL